MLKRALLFVHKWLGIMLTLLFLMWFVSGLVLYYVPFPSLTTSERLNGLPPLSLPAGCCLTAQDAGKRAGLAFTEARLGMHLGLPVWRVLVPAAAKTAGDEAVQSGPRWQALDAVTGELRQALSSAQAEALAQSFSGQGVQQSNVVEADQWSTAQSLNAHRPLLHMTMAGSEGLELYVSPSSGEVLRDTRRSERFWNWLGAIPHWFYFSQLRNGSEPRRSLVIWASSLGVVAVLSGLLLGVWQLFLNPSRWIPYRSFWRRWHHIAGLVAGLVTFTWILSGLLSVNPWHLFSSRAAPASERASWLGAASSATLNPAAALKVALAVSPALHVKEIDLLRVGGQTWYRMRGTAAQLVLRADGDTTSGNAAAMLPDALLESTLLTLRKDVGVPQLLKMQSYDELYYSREYADDSNKKFNKPLPVWRARWPDGLAVYADPASGRVLMRQDDSNRWQRVLYNGLHSFDFDFFMQRPQLRGAVIVLLSILGIALCMTSCVMAWRALAPSRRSGPR
ncbi:MAG: PepSY-associated TM helix domain-containing protein [Pseudomonadota bacterium]